jgi:glycosyltransferase involved in cell wall biosynthesis
MATHACGRRRDAHSLPFELMTAVQRGSPTLVSVILPVRNAVSAVGSQLACLADQDYQGAWELVIADNGSTDGSSAVAKANAGRLPRLVVVDASARPGVCFARNLGAQAASGDFLLFCDADDEVAPGWIAALTRGAPASDLVGGLLDPEALNDRPIRAWRQWPNSTERLPVALDFLPYVVSANCGIWRDVLDAVGGWNEAYRGCTDVELSWRSQLAGYRLGFAPDAVVRYRFRKTLRGLARQFFRIGAAESRLYRDFRGDGVRRHFREALRAWAWIAVNLPAAGGSRERRGSWVRMAARRFGRLAGSAHARAFFP